MDMLSLYDTFVNVNSFYLTIDNVSLRQQIEISLYQYTCLNVTQWKKSV